jgi:hypothetical protein
VLGCQRLTEPLDLEPHEYRDKGRKLSWGDPRHKGLFWVYLVGAAAILGFIFLTRDEGSTATLFGVTALFAFGAGIMFANIFDR